MFIAFQRSVVVTQTGGLVGGHVEDQQSVGLIVVSGERGDVTGFRLAEYRAFVVDQHEVVRGLQILARDGAEGVDVRLRCVGHGDVCAVRAEEIGELCQGHPTECRAQFGRCVREYGGLCQYGVVPQCVEDDDGTRDPAIRNARLRFEEPGQVAVVDGERAVREQLCPSADSAEIRPAGSGR